MNEGIRLDCIHIAREILENRSRAVANATRTDGQVVPFGNDIITTEKIIEEANKLYRFVEVG